MIAREFGVENEKPLVWMGSSFRDYTEFPAEAQRQMGFALASAQLGGKHYSAKPWKGEGPGVLEIVADHQGDTFRAIYTVRFEKAVFMLHAFQKKSKRGIATPRLEQEMVRRRLKMAQQEYKERYETES
jgi:phage-related protein